MEPRIYHHLCGHQLPSYLSIEITEDADTKRIAVLSQIHVNKRNTSFWSYSLDFTDEKILNDRQLFHKVVRDYGLKLQLTLD